MQKTRTMVSESRGYYSKFVLILLVFISFSQSIEGDINIKSLDDFTKGYEKRGINHSSAYLKETIGSQTHLLESVGNKQIGSSCSYKFVESDAENGDTLTASDLVTRQYENLPYPQVKEADLLKEEDYYKSDNPTISSIFPTHILQKLNHFLYRGEQNFQKFFRMIVAGGGTGGVTVFVAEQLNHTNAEVVYLDFSTTSMKISQRRARSRRLHNIIWIRSWIEGVRYLGMGVFEELQCSGVLHHLKSPSFGLRILKDSLTSDGKMGLMVYAKYGRTGVYHIQPLMKLINHNVQQINTELRNTNDTLKVLPKNNWLLKSQNIGDLKTGNIGIYDLLLHKRDVAYSIQTLFEWIERAGLYFVDFDYYVQRFQLKAQYVFNYEIRRKIEKLDRAKQLHSAEILHGSVIKQQIYASKIRNNVADVHDPSNVFYISGKPHGFRDALSNKKNYAVIEHTKHFMARMSPALIDQNDVDFRKIPYYGTQGRGSLTFGFKSNHFNHFLVDRLLQSNRGVKLKTLYSEYRKTSNVSITNDELLGLTEDFYDSVKDTGMFLLRNQYIKPFPKTAYFNYWEINSL